MSGPTITVPDLVIIGRTAPERSKTYGDTVCMGAWSPTFRQWFRIYPISPDERRLGRWSVWRALLKPSTEDDRVSSWELAGSFDAAMAHVGTSSRDETLPQLIRYQARGTDDLNLCRQSMGLIQVCPTEFVLDHRRETEREKQELEAAGFLDRTWVDREGRPARPRLFFRLPHDDPEADPRNLIVCEWGAEILARKYEGDPVTAWSNSQKIGDPDWEHWAAVGNLKNVPTRWVIGVLLKRRRPTAPDYSLFTQAGEDLSGS